MINQVMKHFLPSLTKTRFILSLLCVIICTPLISAKVRTPDEAKKIAESHLSSRSAYVKAPLSQPAATRSADENYYVFDIEGNRGYVIVAADDRYQDILGYADKGNFSSAIKNPNFNFWLSALSSEMKTEPKANARPGRTRAVNAVAVAPLLKTQWGQGKPFNNYCPEVFDWSNREYVIAPAGCVATAMAQVLRYHKWPPAYTTSDNETYQYNWDIMADTYSYEGTESEESIDQIASLLKHCGEAVNMKYEADGSSAFIYDMEDALISKFGYDSSTLMHIERDIYGYEELHNLIYKELEEGRPILTRGNYPGADGHAFVLDGSTGDDFFHFNWGWSGYCDGYYRLTSLRPSDFGIGGSSEGYSFYVSFTIGVQPARSEVTVPQQTEITGDGDLALLYKDEYREMEYSEEISILVTTENNPYPGFTNSGRTQINGNSDEETQAKFYTLLTNLETGEETLSERFGTLGRYDLPPDYYTSQLWMYADNLADNTRYKASLYFKNGSADSLHPIRFAPACRSYILIERKGDKVYVTEPSAESTIKGDIPADLTKLVRTSGNKPSFRIKISNPGDIEYLGQVKWRYSNSDDYIDDYLSDYAMVNLLPGDEEEVEFILYNLKNVSPGTYTVGLYDFRDRLIGEARTVEISDLTVDIDETMFPDPVLREYVASNFDLNGDGILSEKELSQPYELKFDGLQIADYTGLENFFSAGYLTISNSDVSELKLPEGLSISHLIITNCPIESIELGNCPKVWEMSITGSNIKDLDLSDRDNLQYISLTGNKLERLILPKSGKIAMLSVSDNLLKELDPSGNSNLYALYFSNNQISDIDLSGLENLEYLNCTDNPLEKLDLTGKEKLYSAYFNNCNVKELLLSPSYPSLAAINGNGNQLEGKLDLSGCPALVSLQLSDNHLSELILCDMPELTQIFLENCSLTGKLDLSASSDLDMVFVSGNEFSELLIGDVPKLRYLYIDGSHITGTIDLSSAENLSTFSAIDNQLEGIILGNNPELNYLCLQGNQIEGTLDISSAPNLMHLFASGNKISELKYGDHPNMMSLDLSNNALTHFHFDDFPVLSYRSVSSQNLSASLSTPNFNLSSLIDKGFETDRASNWKAVWKYGDGIRTANCEVINGEVVIPEEAGGELDLVYTYNTHREYNYLTDFSIHITRDGFGAVDDLIADGSFSVNGSSISFADGIYGEIYTPGGMNVFKGTGETPALPSGIYIVRIGSAVTKIAIP